MTTIQLEFNLFNDNQSQNEIFMMQEQLNAQKTSADKVRKRLFKENGELKMQVQELQEDVRKIKRMMGLDKEEWIYKTEESLFESASQKTISILTA